MNSSRSSMLAAAIATPVVFSTCALLIVFLQPRCRRWLEQRISSRTQRDIEGQHASDDPVTPAPDSSARLKAADGVVSISPNSATTNTTTVMTPTSPKLPETSMECTSACPELLQEHCAQVCTSPPSPPLPPEALPSPPPSPSSRATSRSSRNGRLRANVSGLINRISKAARPPSVGSNKGRRRSRADPVLPRATPTFRFNADDMFAPRRRPPLPQRPQAPSMIIQRGRTTSPVPPQTPPPQSLLPPPPADLASNPDLDLTSAFAPVLAVAPLSIPASQSSRGFKPERGRTSRIRPLPPLPKLSLSQSQSRPQSPDQSSVLSRPTSPLSSLTSPISSLRSLPRHPHPMSLTSALSPPSHPHPLPPVPTLEPPSVSLPMSMPPGITDPITFQPSGLDQHQHQHDETSAATVAAVALAPPAPHYRQPLPVVSPDDCSESMPPPYTSHYRPS